MIEKDLIAFILIIVMSYFTSLLLFILFGG